MKKFTFITGALSFSLTSVGFLFKTLHYTGADILLLAGISIFSILFVPSVAKYLYNKEK